MICPPEYGSTRMRFREMRWPCDHPVRLHGPNGPIAGRIVNLSGFGARIVAAGLSVGDQVALDLAPGRLPGRIRWVRDGAVGLRFAQQMSARDMARIRGHQGGILVRSKWSHPSQELR
jgi:hypothetical protein